MAGWVIAVSGGMDDNTVKFVGAWDNAKPEGEVTTTLTSPGMISGTVTFKTEVVDLVVSIVPGVPLKEIFMAMGLISSP